MTDNARGVSEPGAYHWYALRCASNRERAVRAALDLRGITSFVPMYWARSQWSDRTKLVERLLFPGYLFVRCCAPDELAEALGVGGVLQVLDSNLRPTAVSDSEISSVERVISSLLPIEPVPASFAVGERVRVAAGPLKGASGVVLRDGAKARLVVKVELLGRAVACEVAPGDLETCPKN